MKPKLTEKREHVAKHLSELTEELTLQSGWLSGIQPAALRARLLLLGLLQPPDQAESRGETPLKGRRCTSFKCCRAVAHCSSGLMFEWPNKGHVLVAPRFLPQGFSH